MWPQKSKWLNSCSRYDARVPFILQKNCNNINVKTKFCSLWKQYHLHQNRKDSLYLAFINHRPSSHCCLIECSLICCLHTWWAASSRLAVVRMGPRETGGGDPGGLRGPGGGRSIKTTCYCGETSDHMVRRSCKPVWFSMCFRGLTAPGAAPFYEY